MKAVVIGIGCDDDLIIAEAFKAVFDTERHHHIVELRIFVNGGAFFAVHIFGLTAQRKKRLRKDVAARNH